MDKINKKIKIGLTAIIIYGGQYNEVLFEKAKKSVSFCDELILINGKNGSFANWRNEGLKKANGKWILYVDSDEEVTSALRQEMTKLLKSQMAYDAYAIPRKNYIFEQEFKHGGQWPDYQKRLFLRSNLVSWLGNLHEEPKFIGKLGFLKNPLIHHKNINLSQMIEKTNKWSEIEASLLFKSNHPKMNFIRFTTVASREFYLRFIKQLSFLDGTKGIIYGIYQIYSRLITYSKLWEKQQSTIRI